MDDKDALFLVCECLWKQSFIKKNFLFRAKVIFLESATLHLNNENLQMHKV